jgi:hypothetical protein
VNLPKCEIKGCIYLWRNETNGKGYVGQHHNVATVKVRWVGHVKAAKAGKSQMYIHRAIRVYGAVKRRLIGMKILVRCLGWVFIGLAVYGLLCILAQLYSIFC